MSKIKKPRSAYNFYVKRWKTMSPDERAPFNQKAAEDKFGRQELDAVEKQAAAQTAKTKQGFRSKAIRAVKNNATGLAAMAASNAMKAFTGGIQGTHDTGDGVTAGMPNWKMGTDVLQQAHMVRDYNLPGIAHQLASRVVHHLPKSL